MRGISYHLLTQTDDDDVRYGSGGFDFCLGNLGLATLGDPIDLSYAISNGTSLASLVTADAAAFGVLKAVLVNGTTELATGATATDTYTVGTDALLRVTLA